MKGNAPEVLTENRYLVDYKLQDYLATEVPKYVKNDIGRVQNPKVVLDVSRASIVNQF